MALAEKKSYFMLVLNQSFLDIVWKKELDWRHFKTKRGMDLQID
jgi:hypothetical protein